jgi:uncharacterized membrane protein YkvA (DUF1232 family)
VIKVEKLKDEQLDRSIKQYKRKALEYIKDRNKAKELLKEASKKSLSETGRIEGFRNQLLLLLDAYHDWISGNYRHVPYKTLTLIVIGILYFVVPTDFIPDIFLGVGLVDDAAIIAFIFKQVDKDLQEYKDWKTKKYSSLHTDSDSSTIKE